MTRTFLVALELGDSSSDLDFLAEDIKDSLQSEGFDVSSVKPWNSPSQETLSQFSNPWSPPDNGSKPLDPEYGF